MKPQPTAKASSYQHPSSSCIIDIQAEPIPSHSTTMQPPPLSRTRMRQRLNQTTETKVHQQMVGTTFLVGGIATLTAAGTVVFLANTPPDHSNPISEGADTSSTLTGNEPSSARVTQVISISTPPVSLSESTPQAQFSQVNNRTSHRSAQEEHPASPLIHYQTSVGKRLSHVELKLLNLQQYLALNVYETSFIDKLLDQNISYQNQLQQLQAIDVEIAIELGKPTVDPDRLAQLSQQFEQANFQLQNKAQAVLQQYITASQGTATSPLRQEPLYQNMLSQLTDYTHEQKVLLVRQSNVEVAKTELKKRYA